MENRRFITQSWPTGLVGTIGMRLISATGATLLARETTGITEEPVGSGRYIKTVSVDPVNYPIEHIWDNAVDFASGIVGNEVSKTKLREAFGGTWTNESAETIDVVITD